MQWKREEIIQAQEEVIRLLRDENKKLRFEYHRLKLINQLYKAERKE